MLKVCIDPGHNGIGPDTGAAFKGLLEQTLTLKMAGMVRQGLEQQGGFQVMMTRDGDKVDGPCATVLDSLRTRCRIANEGDADLMVSIHVNAGGGTGSEVLIIDRGGKAEECANIIAPLLAEAGAWPNRGVKVQNLYVLRETKMPAILTENGFIDHEQDHSKLRQDQWLEAIAKAHIRGICSYFGREDEGNSQETPPSDSRQGLPALIIYYGEAEERVVPFLQEKLQAPALRLALITPQVINAARKIYGVGGIEEAYSIEGRKIPLYKLYGGESRIETAQAVLQAIRTGDV